ncbi:uncharacterized protein NEMIN01_1050 [Nematocida minor]|uniref:uncharacterized protein n=1 Tax=Nematocida minor TaxID=1912983 RepID=UPI00221EA318|nr:uncharacterized protein NEMIN01_1050 [Nematocida minor]KAI5190426.1 uncharacterized protein NEMIN01_1050 [Nematocida minor]
MGEHGDESFKRYIRACKARRQMEELLFQCELCRKNKNFDEIIKVSDRILNNALQEALKLEPVPRDYGKMIDALVFITQKMPGSRYKNTAFSEAYCLLGKIFETGIVLPENIKKAHEYYTIAAEHSNPFGCYRLAHFYEHGIACGKNLQKAAHFYKLSANGGCCRGMHRYGMMLLEGSVCKRDVKGGVFYLEQARKLATPNYPHVLYDLGVCYEKVPLMAGHILEDQEYALAIFQEGDKLGCPRSSVRLGHAYNYGNLGLSKDTEKSIHYYTRAESVSGEARFELYRIYLAQNNQEASLEWLKKSAMLGHPHGLKIYADALEKGIGVPENKKEALWWFIIAKSKGMQVDMEIKRCK